MPEHVTDGVHIFCQKCLVVRLSELGQLTVDTTPTLSHYMNVCFMIDNYTNLYYQYNGEITRLDGVQITRCIL